MKTLLRVLSLGLLVNAALVYGGTGASTITLSTTPVAVNCGASNWVNTVTVSVIPGGEGKVYVGQSSQTPSTGAGIAQILFPNAGAHSEQFQLLDPSGNDTINLCNLYVAGEISGEVALASWNYKNGTSTGNELVLAQAQAYLGPIPSTEPIGCSGVSGPFVPFGTAGLLQDSTLAETDANYYFSKIRVQVIPGQEGKVHLAWCNGGTDGFFHTLYPNSGTLSEHSAWSEGWEVQDPGGQNGLPMFEGEAAVQAFSGWGFIPDIGTEGLQVALWQLQASGSVVDPSEVYYFSGTSGVPPATFSSTTASRLRFRVEPGYCGKFYFGNSSLNPATAAGLYKTLFPNCAGGWSEEFVAIPDSIVNVPITMNIAAEFPTDFLSSETLEAMSYAGAPVASSQSVGGGTTVVSTTPTALGTGFVHRITISVTPGQEGQMFIGASSMSTDLGGLVAILYPNTIGRWSEQFDLIDPVGDGIDLSALYVMGEVAGEYVQVVTETTGITPPTPLSLFEANVISFPGTCPGNYSYAVSLTGCPGSTPFSAVRIQVIPGLDPAVFVGTAAMLSDTEPDSTLSDTMKILYPNWGDYDVHEGFSETFAVTCQDGTNCLTTDAFSLWPEYAYYPVLVATWTH